MAVDLPACRTLNGLSGIGVTQSVTRRGRTMSKQNFGADNWLYILTNAISNFVEEGGQVEVIEDAALSSIVIVLSGVQPGDRRLHPDFRALVGVAQRVEAI
jgi:hypothetical protein